MINLKSEKRRVLLAVRESEVRTDIEALVQFSFGDSMQFTSTVDGVDATAKVGYQKFSCIILDCDLPKKSGEAVINAIRNSQYNQDTPVIFLDNGDAGSFGETIPGIHFLEKPVSGAKLIALAQQTMGLGEGDQRTCAALVNVIAQATNEFFTVYRKSSLSVDGPDVSVCSEALRDHNVSISVSYRGAHVHLILSFAQKVLELMKQDLTFLKGLEMEKIASSLADFTIQRSIASFATGYNARSEIKVIGQGELQSCLAEKVIRVGIGNDEDLDIQLIVARG